MYSKNNIITLVLILLTVIAVPLKAQTDQQEKTTKVVTGLSFFLNPEGINSSLPFWMHVNKDGRVDQSSANAIHYIDGYSILYETETFNIETGGSISTRISNDPLLFVDKAYVKLQAFNFKLMGGRFIDPLSKKENELSTGSFMYSRNATPIPKIAFATDGFVNVPWTKGIVSYKGLFGHGWFEQERFVSNAYLHEKYFYLGIKYAFFEVVGGIVHNAQWAGVSEGSRGKVPSGWSTFREVVFASGSSDPDAPGAEQSNVVGNSVAAYDFGLSLFFKDVDLRAYRLFYLEDKVSSRLRSPWDGIWGLSIKPKGVPLVQNILWEHINTKRQDSFDYEPYGTANYYNNSTYRTGWTYGRRVIGNPLILSDGSKNRSIYNNIIIAHHGGVSGSLTDQLSYKLLYTFSRNYGTASDQIIRRLDRSECGAIPGTVCAELKPLREVKKINHSVMLHLSYSPEHAERVNYAFSIASDVGELYKNRLGMMLKLEYDLISSER